MKLLKIKDFLKEAETSKSSIYRLFNNHPHLKENTKLVSNRRLIPIGYNKYFDMDEMIKDEKRLIQDNEDKKELIDLILNDGDGITSFWQKQWDLFVTVSYKDEISSISSHRKMNKIFDSIKHEYGHESDFRMLFTTEEYKIRDGYHNHFVFYSSNKSMLPNVKKYILQHFRFDHVTLDDYNKYKPGVYYICKHGLKGESWDFLH